MTSKYICIDYGLAGDTIFIFPEYVSHKEVADKMADIHTILSAGFVRENVTGKLVCYGCSDSIGIESRPVEDTAIINRMFGMEA